MKKEKIKYNKNRAILSDILPYEIPIIFSNRHFYKFLTKYKIKLIRRDYETFQIFYDDSNLDELQKKLWKKL